MSKDREVEIAEILSNSKHMELYILCKELFTLRRERHRDKLERQEDNQLRGRALECKDLLQIFS